MKKLCSIYRCSRREGMYLYVDRAENVERVPEELLKNLGRLELAMTLALWPERRLARAKAADVLAAIDEKGFYLQMPPAEERGAAAGNAGGGVSRAQVPFWQRKSLSEMTPGEWESLCDGCGKCCLLKLEDEDSGERYYTDLACRHLQRDRCRCDCYGERTRRVADCVELRAENVGQLGWLPGTCAYRLVAEGRELPEWHPLISGDPDSVHRAGISVRGRCLSEDDVHPDEWEEHIVQWVE